MIFEEVRAELPTEFGNFRIVGFTPDAGGREHIAIVQGEVEGRADVPIRIHSECLTGDVLGSLRCDCRAQLLKALEELGRSEFGVVLYLRQEGRGIGLLNKIRAYALQDDGADTVEANRLLGFRDDQRDYGVAASMLESLGVKSVQLKTNNPDKVQQLGWYGIEVSARIPHAIEPNPHNRHYLETKRLRSGHLLDPMAAK